MESEQNQTPNYHTRDKIVDLLMDWGCDPTPAGNGWISFSILGHLVHIAVTNESQTSILLANYGFYFPTDEDKDTSIFSFLEGINKLNAENGDAQVFYEINTSNSANTEIQIRVRKIIHIDTQQANFDFKLLNELREFAFWLDDRYVLPQKPSADDILWQRCRKEAMEFAKEEDDKQEEPQPESPKEPEEETVTDTKESLQKQIYDDLSAWDLLKAFFRKVFHK